MTRIDLLSQVSLFSSLAEVDLRELADACQPRNFERGEVLFHEGDPATALYVLQSGQVKIVLIGPDGEATILHVVGPGDSLGELSLADGKPRSATAVALTRVETLALHREAFLEALERHRSVERALVNALTTMVRQSNSHLQDVTSLNVPERLAKKLLKLADQHGEATPEGIRISVPLTQSELGLMLGLSQDCVGHHLGRLRAEGILISRRDGIVLRKLEALRKQGATRGSD